MILRAEWILPIASPPIRRGMLHVENGRIVAVGSTQAVPAGDVVDLGPVAILPGFVNAHTHLELTNYAGILPPSPLFDWLNGLIQLRRRPGAADAELQACARGAELSLRAGVTCVGDISRTGRRFEALLDSPIRKLCFFELISGAGDPPRDPDELREAATAFEDRIADGETASIGLSPHALYTVAWNDLRRVAALAGERDLPLTLHFCETREEREWLELQSGRMADFLAQYPVFNSMQLAQGPPLACLHRAGLTRLAPLLAHCNYITDDEIADLARTSCSVAFCPRAHRFFGHPPHRWRDMLAAGINVCVGTDSLASNESLSILDELRFLRTASPQVPPATLLEMGTIRAAHALGLADQLGALRPGSWADFIAMPMGSAVDDPAAALLDGATQPQRVWIAGREVTPGRS